MSSCANAEENKKKGQGEEMKDRPGYEESLVRQPAVSGQFYPSDPKGLRDSIQQFLQQASPAKPKGRLKALICPHAGYQYSGQVAAFSYKLLEGEDFDTVILLGPSHRFNLKGISVWPSGTYKTPLGDVKINKRVAAQLLESSNFTRFEKQAHMNEHSLEVQIPFLQAVLKDFLIVPVLVNRLSTSEIIQISRKIASLLNDSGTLLIVSTDLSHYHPYDEANDMDKKAIDAIKNIDIEGLMELLKNGESEICGETSVMLLLETVKHMGHSVKIDLIKYANSGDTSGMKDRVVGYASMSMTISDEGNMQQSETNGDESADKKSGSDPAERGDGKLPESENLLNEQEKKKLLQIARSSITAHLAGKPLPEFDVTEPRLLEQRGAFVTLHKRGMLRGCIGYVRAIMPLYKSVSDCAVSAAVKDYRFPPLQRQELDEIDIEISALTPLKKIDDIKQIRVGEHGLYISLPPRTGLLLPQVATEYGWDRLEFLAHTCQKAGIPDDAWQKGADIYIFSAQVFGEKEG
ncbi:AmmeMemoRadiSam system protein B [bacterium]|nr:AmmeMemoRadiSam system protein B [bacterium]